MCAPPLWTHPPFTSALNTVPHQSLEPLDGCAHAIVTAGGIVGGKARPWDSSNVSRGYAGPKAIWADRKSLGQHVAWLQKEQSRDNICFARTRVKVSSCVAKIFGEDARQGDFYQFGVYTGHSMRYTIHQLRKLHVSMFGRRGASILSVVCRTLMLLMVKRAGG